MAEHILVVDDEPNFLLLMKGILEKGGYQVTTVEGPGEAIEAVRSDAPDLILLDVNLSVSDGFDLCENLGADKIPIVFLTAEPFRGKQEKMLGSSSAGYIEKPVKPEVLLTWVEKTLTKWKRAKTT